MRRGDVRAALLIALLDGPGHGYELIQRIESKADGRWRPSPGSVYPSLQALADQALVTSTEQDGKRVFELTDAGRTEADERIERSGIFGRSTAANAASCTASCGDCTSRPGRSA